MGAEGSNNHRITLAIVATKLEAMHEDIREIRAELERQRAEIDRLKESDRRWGAFGAVLAAVGSALAALIGVSK